jgi:FkbM family methyltransferase
MNKALRLIKSFLLLLNRKRMGVFNRISELTKFDHDFNVSWSQDGEDLALISILREINQGKYIDVGAHHPSRFSVTRHLYQKGWSGVNVEANEDLISEFKEKRPRDTNVARFVGSPSKKIFHIFSEPALSTSSSEIRDLLVEQSRKLIRSTEVEPISLREIYDTYIPDRRLDLLTVDAEGSDMDVLTSLDFPTLERDRWPRYVMVETAPPVENALNFDSVIFLKSLGYTPLVVLTMATVLAAPKK